MSEPQTESETEHEADAEPSPGPWQADVDHQPNETPLIIAHTKPEGNAYIVAEVNQNGLLEGDWKTNARLIAAAGTAAKEVKEMGYDPEKVVRALPKILNQIESLLQGELEHEGVIFPRITDLLRELGGRPLEKDALASAEGSGDD